MFELLDHLPEDPILGLSAACQADPNPQKVDLTVGVYRDERGRTPVLEAVRQAQQALCEDEQSKAYIAQAGVADFNRGLRELLLGPANPLLATGRVVSVQTPGGSGALCIGAELLKLANPRARAWVSTPTWGNHLPLLGRAGLKVLRYRYYDPARQTVDIEGMLADLQKARAGDMLLLHACCHNPSGADLSQQQWQAVLTLAGERGLLLFIDAAYLGLGDGLEQDTRGLRQATEQFPELLIAASCSKNLGLYRERCGALVVLGKDRETAGAAASQGIQAARHIYSMPPAHGAIIAGRIFCDEALTACWHEELGVMRGRISDLREALSIKLGDASGRNFGFIRREKGLFSFLGLTPAQVEALRKQYSVYMLASSRVNVAGVNHDNIDYLAAAVASVLRDLPQDGMAHTATQDKAQDKAQDKTQGKMQDKAQDKMQDKVERTGSE